MNKRVHEIAKERGLTTKEVLAKLKAAGIEVKASSNVDEDVAVRALANGEPAAAPVKAPKRTAPKAPAQPQPAGDGAAATASQSVPAAPRTAPDATARSKRACRGRCGF